MYFDNPFVSFCASVYLFLIKMGGNLQSVFLLYMRITWGHLLFLTGLEKFEHMDQTVQFFQGLHILHPSFLAHAVASFELLGGILMIFRFASRLISIPLMIIMIIALGTAHATAIGGFDWLLVPTALVIQAPYPYLITAILLFVFGPGKISVDGWIKRQIHHHHS